MRVLITTAGSHGDINPFVAIGRALRERGHAALMLVNPYYRDLVEEAGVEFAPIGETLDLRDLKNHPDVMHRYRGGRTVLDKWLIPYSGELLDELGPLIDRFRPDIVVHHHIAMLAPHVCREKGVKTAVVVLAPAMWLSAEDVFVSIDWMPDPPPRWMRWVMRRLGPAFLRRTLDPRLNRVRRAHGLAKERDIYLRCTRGGDVNLGMWSPIVRGPMASDPPTGVICGFPWHDRHGAQEHAPEEIERFLEAGGSAAAPILFTLGSAAAHVPGRFYHDAAEACRLLGRRGVLLIGRSNEPPEGMPEGVAAFSYAPFSAVMPRCCAIVHHGGIGTTAQALRSGRPAVVVPHAHDQFDNAARVRRLGVAESLPAHKVTAERLAGVLRKLLGEPGYAWRAAEIGVKVAREDGAVVAVGLLEKTVAGGDRTYGTDGTDRKKAIAEGGL